MAIEPVWNEKLLTSTGKEHVKCYQDYQSGEPGNRRSFMEQLYSINHLLQMPAEPRRCDKVVPRNVGKNASAKPCVFYHIEQLYSRSTAAFAIATP
jgi:hypothetical protein